MMSRKSSNNSWLRRLRPLAVMAIAAALSASAFGQSQQFPTYTPGENQNATTGPTYSAPLTDPWVVSDGTIITPAGTQVYLGITTRAKAIALNPTGNGTAAVLQMGAPQSVSIFCVATAGCDGGTYTQGQVMQNYIPSKTNSGSSMGITYTPNGQYLLFSQDGDYGPAYVAIASVSPTTGLLSNYAEVSVPLDVDGGGFLTNVTCYPWVAPYNTASAPPSGSPPGTTGSIEIPCGQTVSLVSDGAPTSYPMGIAVTPNGNTAYVVLDNNDTITSINLTGTPVQGPELRVGQVPNNIVISPGGTTAYVANEAGKVPTANNFQGYSNGTPVVAVYPTGATSDGTIS
ncbi:MAG: hypothetical protein ABSE92_10145, partial [Terriglobales bacterium]